MKTRITAIMAVLLLSFGAAFFTGCADGEMTRVTIQIKSDDVAMVGSRTSLLSRIRDFFVTPAYAGASWSAAHNSLELKVEGPDMDTIIASLPASASSYSLEVPSGSARVFTIISTSSGDVTNNWGGRMVVPLAPGVEVQLPINMLPMTEIWMIGPASTYQISINWAYVDNAALVSGYQVLRATNPDGPYDPIATETPYTSSFFTDNCIPDVTNFYKIKVITQNGIGIESPYDSLICN